MEKLYFLKECFLLFDKPVIPFNPSILLLNEETEFVSKAFKTEDIIHPDNFGSVKYENTVVTFWCDLKRLEKELLEISPEDKKLIKRFIYMVYKIQNMPLPTDIPLSEMSIWRKIKFGFSVFPYLKMYLLMMMK